MNEFKVLQKERKVLLAFADGSHFELPIAYLRSASAAADHKQAMIANPNQDFSEVNIITVEPVGLYALKIVFDDGHQTGIYSFSLLQSLAQKFAGTLS
ncbi:MAG: DUF971 domain-containing protein [Gammaproteobacteria bacterium]|nr:DUF971 domain-containing protein [Gammaproteobacteria bacterium]